MNYKASFKRITNNKTLVNGSLFSLFSFFSQGCGFLVLILVAGYILPTDYGRLSIFNTIVAFFTYVVGFSTNSYVSVSYFREPRDIFKKDFTAIILIFVSSLILFSFIATILPQNVVRSLEVTRRLLYYALIAAFTTSIFNIHQDFLRIKENLRHYGFWSICNALFNLVLTLLLVISFRQGWLGKVYSQLISFVFLAVVSFISFSHAKLFSFDWDWKRYKTILLFSFPVVLHFGATWVRQGLDRYIINYYYSTYEVGLFSLAINLVTVIIMIGIAFNATNSVEIYKILGNKDSTYHEKKEALHRQTRTIAIIYTIASVVYTLIILPVCYYLLPKYRMALPYFLVLSGYGLLQCFYFLYSNYMFFYKETKQLMYITFGSSLLHLALSLLLTQYSLYLTAIIYVLVQAVILVLVRYYARRILQQNLPLSVQ